MNGNKLIKALCALVLACALLFGCTARQTVAEPPTTAEAETTAAEERTVQQESTTEITTESTTQTTKVSARPTTTAAKAKPTTTAKKAVATTFQPQPKGFEQAKKIASYFFIDKAEIHKLASKMANSSRIYYVRLSDGTKTYYMAVDLQTADALSLANPQVLRELCRQLDKKQNTKAHSGYELMDYTHLVGELELHFVGYLLTGAIGGENGALARFYRSCSVADLNIDEARFGPMIDFIGAVYG